MNDLISRQAAIHEIHKQVWLAETAKTFLTEALNELPSADAVVVVRCKDCLYWDMDETDETAGRCEMWECYRRASNDYCSEGRKRND